jgi:prevent-host-death family protein
MHHSLRGARATGGFNTAKGCCSKSGLRRIRRHEPVVITRRRGPTAVLVPADEQEVPKETLEILQDEDILDALRESEDDVEPAD